MVLVLISLIVAVSVADSQFINVFYGTDFGSPGDVHLMLFILFVIVASIINIVLLHFAKRNGLQATTSRPVLFRITYIGTSVVQYSILLVFLMIISEMLMFHKYNKTFLLLVIYLSHLWGAGILGVLSVTFVRWFRLARSLSIIIHAVVFIVIIFIILITIPLLTEQFANQSQMIYPRDFTSLVSAPITPSRSISFIFGLGAYVLPLLLISSWMLTVSLLKPYATRIGKKTFWLIVSIPLLYQVLSYIIKDTNLITDPAMLDIIYSTQIQLVLGINFQVSGLFFAIAFLTIARIMKRESMKKYLVISSIGIISLFTSLQPGMPFYAAYPPFGHVTLLFLGLSSYLLLVGILGCAAYVSRDRELRREIYKGLEVNSEILNKMGMAEMQREMERKILPIVDKAKFSEQMRVRIDPDIEDVKIMINEVLSEIGHKGSKDRPDNRHSNE